MASQCTRVSQSNCLLDQTYIIKGSYNASSFFMQKYAVHLPEGEAAQPVQRVFWQGHREKFWAPGEDILLPSGPHLPIL